MLKKLWSGKKLILSLRKLRNEMISEYYRRTVGEVYPEPLDDPATWLLGTLLLALVLLIISAFLFM